MKTKLEILEETVAYIKEKGRAVRKNDDGSMSCLYYTPTVCCAFGRCMKDEYKNEEFAEGHVDHTANNILSFEGFDILKDEYQVESIDFWRDIQVLHDDEDNWDNGQLTEEGKYWYNTIKKNITDDRYRY